AGNLLVDVRRSIGKNAAVERTASERFRLVVRRVVKVKPFAVLPEEASLDAVIRIQSIVAELRDARGPDHIAFRYIDTGIEDWKVHRKPAVQLLKNVDDFAVARMEIQPEQETIESSVRRDVQGDVMLVF